MEATMKRVNILIIVVLVALLVSGCAGTQAKPTPTPQAQDIPAVVSASGKLLPARWANLSFLPAEGGPVVEVNVQAGDKVEAGQVLAQLDDTDAKLALAQANAALNMSQAQLAQLKAGARPEEITQQKQAVQAAQAALAGAQARLDQLQAGARQAEVADAEAALRQAEAAWKVKSDAYDDNLRDGALGATEEHLRAQVQAAAEAVTAAKARLAQIKAGPTEAERRGGQAAVAAAQAQYDAAQAQLDQMMAGATKEQIAVAEANVAQAQAAADLAQANLDKLQLTAPFAGTVGNVYAREGELLAAGQTVLALGDLSSLRVETTDLSEVDVARVTVGQPVNVTFDALKGQTLQGRVTRIAPMSSASQGGVNYTVIVELDQLNPALRWGMTAFTDIQVK
jgi:multidrug efflux pump subunit AcrA (membrane-fusion protein)